LDAAEAPDREIAFAPAGQAVDEEVAPPGRAAVPPPKQEQVGIGERPAETLHEVADHHVGQRRAGEVIGIGPEVIGHRGPPLRWPRDSSCGILSGYAADAERQPELQTPNEGSSMRKTVSLLALLLAFTVLCPLGAADDAKK